MTSTGALIMAAANPPVTNAALAGSPAAAAAPAPGDAVLSVKELLQLLEQNAGFAQALAAAGGPAAPPAAAGASAATVEPATSLPVSGRRIVQER